GCCSDVRCRYRCR
nr:Chain A, Alpha-conotoxin RgIA [synthetic construct]